MRTPIPLRFVVAALGLGVGLFTTGCVSFFSLEPAELTAEWKMEIQRPHPLPVDLSGTYLDRGLFAGPDYQNKGALTTASLA